MNDKLFDPNSCYNEEILTTEDSTADTVAEHKAEEYLDTILENEIEHYFAYLRQDEIFEDRRNPYTDTERKKKKQ